MQQSVSEEEMKAVFGEKKPDIKFQTGHTDRQPVKKKEEKGVIGKAPKFRGPTKEELNNPELYEKFLNARNVNALKEKIRAMNELDGRLVLLKDKYTEFNLDSESINLSLNDIQNAIEKDTDIINKISN